LLGCNFCNLFYERSSSVSLFLSFSLLSLEGFRAFGASANAPRPLRVAVASGAADPSESANRRILFRDVFGDHPDLSVLAGDVVGRSNEATRQGIAG